MDARPAPASTGNLLEIHILGLEPTPSEQKALKMELQTGLTICSGDLNEHYGIRTISLSNQCALVDNERFLPFLEMPVCLTFIVCA